MLRLVCVTPSYAPCIGGAERLLQGVAEQLADRGHAVSVLTFDCASQVDFTNPLGAGLPQREIVNGVEVRRVKPDGGSVGRLHRWWLRQRGGWRSTQWLLKSSDFPLGPPSGMGIVPALIRMRADVVLSVNWCFGVSFWTTLTARLRRAAHVAVPILHIDRPWAANPLFPEMLEKSDAVIVLTEAERTFVRSLGASNVTVGGGGVDPAPLLNLDGDSIRSRHELGSRPVVGFVGRQDEGKGVPDLIRAMRRIWERVPDAVLLLAGPSKHRKPEVERELAVLPADRRRHVLLIDDFADGELGLILNACDVVAVPSVEEAFGLVLVEGWLCGKPVIGADIAPTRCLIEPGVNGWTVTPGDVEDLAAKLLLLLSDPEQRVAFGEAGRRKALARYTLEKVADAWERALLDVAGGVRGR